MFHAELVVADRAGGSSSRAVDAPECLEAVTAVALISALYLDGVPVVAPDTAEAERPVSPPPPPAAPRKPPPAATAAPDLPPPADGMDARPWRPFRVGLSYAAQQGAGPAVMHGLAVSGEIERRSGWGTRLSVSYGDTGDESVGIAAARFRLLAARADACWGLVRPWLVLHGCGALELGLVRASGIASERIVSTSTATHAWLAASPLLRIGIGPTDTVYLEATGGPLFSLLRHSFVFESPSAVVHEYPAVGWTAGVGAIVPLP